MEHLTRRKARLAVSAAFFLFGLVAATWVTRIPAIQAHLALSPGGLGVAFLAMNGAGILADPLTGYLIAQRGSRLATIGGAGALAVLLPALALAPTLILLVLVMLAFGAASSVMNVAMNAQAVAVENRYARPTLSSFHALFSLGEMAGAVVGAGIAAVGIGPLIHFLLAAALLGTTLPVFALWMLTGPMESATESPWYVWPTGQLLALRVLLACAVLVEGAVRNWSTVYLRQTLSTSAGLAALGFGAFTLAMTVGRLSGDWLTARLGSVHLLRVGSVSVAAGLVFSLGVATPPVAILGFACIGWGISFVPPLVVSASGRVHGVSPGPSLAAVSLVSSLGLVGAPLIGFAADAVSLRAALAVLAMFAAAIALLAPAARSCSGR